MIIDFKCNRYGELFIEFLTNVIFCMLNGRNYDKNDFTCFTSRGQSVWKRIGSPHIFVLRLKFFDVIS